MKNHKFGDAQYEAHITVEHICHPEDLLLDLKGLGLKIVDLVNIKLDGLDSEEGVITTLHGADLAELTSQVEEAVLKLQFDGYTVLRYKIESTIIDSKYEDNLYLL